MIKSHQPHALTQNNQADGNSSSKSTASTPLYTPDNPQDVLFLTEPGDTAAISMSDIHQGGLADCFFLAPLGEIAQYDPSFIRSMVTQNSNGTDTVRLYEPTGGGTVSFSTTSFTAVYETVDPKQASSIGVNANNQTLVGSQREVWPQVIEEAFAQYNGGYANINGGVAMLAMEQLTGQTGGWTPASQVSLSQLLSLQGKDMITFQTFGSNEGGGLVADHSYMFDGIVGAGANAAVKLVNPWGFDQPANPIPISQLGNLFTDIQYAKL